MERVCCFSGSNSAGKDLKHCLHLVPDPSAWRFIACGCYGVITFYIYMSSFNVKDPSTSYKLLPCCRARQTTRHTQCARGGVSSKGTDSCASESLLCPEDLSRVPRLCEVGHRSLCTLSHVPLPLLAWVWAKFLLSWLAALYHSWKGNGGTRLR